MKTSTLKVISTTLFLAPLLTVARIWKHPKCPSIYNCIKKIEVFYLTIIFERENFTMRQIEEIVIYALRNKLERQMFITVTCVFNNKK